MSLIHELHLSQVVTFLLVSIVGIVWDVNDKRFILRANQPTQVYYKAKGQITCDEFNDKKSVFAWAHRRVHGVDPLPQKFARTAIYL